jgi:hypothetical protein
MVFICFLSFCLLRLCSRFVECRLGRGRSANTISQHLIVFHDLDTGAVLHAATNPAPVNTMPIAVPAGNIPAMVLDTDASCLNPPSADSASLAITRIVFVRPAEQYPQETRAF